jgi:phosphatidylinositol dimannoside acyltransferase
MTDLAYDGALFRRLAAWGARNGPEWFVRYSPGVIGVAMSVLLPEARRAVRRNLVRIRGEGSSARDALDIARTFASYAGSFTESLTSGSKNSREPRAIIYGARHFDRALESGRGIVLVTAHTGGWETIGMLIGRDFGVRMMMVMRRERDSDARAVHDAAREAAGFELIHVDDDPLDALPLLRHLREGGVVGVQIDRAPKGKRACEVTFLGSSGAIPEGPIRLAQLSGAPLVAVYCTRSGFRSYRVEVSAPMAVPRRADDASVNRIAQRIADDLAAFLRRNPTQWFDFGRA